MRKLLLFAFTVLGFTMAHAQCSNLFFSEYLEGSSNEKAIEIYNPTAGAINLTNYVIYRYNNGSATPTDSLFPQGMLAAGDVWVAGNPSATANIVSVSDTLHTITFYNGDDAMELVQRSPRQTLDIIGIIGVDPGTNWPVGTGATSEFTLVRKIGVQGGNTNWAVAATEYDVYPQNTYTYLGSHTMTSCVPAVNPVVSFGGAASTIAENGGSANITVNIASPNSNATSVTVVLGTGSTATGGGVDYTFTSTTITFPANDSTPIVINVPIVDDALAEGSETVVLNLTMASNNATFGNGLDVHTLTITDNDFPTYPIGTIASVDANGVLDSLGLKCWTSGVVYGVNMRPAGLQFTIIDPTGGIGVFRATGNLGYTITETDSIKILGTVAQFNGLAQINVDSVVFLSTGNALKTPTLTSTLIEANESDLVIFKNAHLVNPTQWTGAGSGFNVDVTDGVNTIQVRIDADVNLYSMPAPVGNFHVCGIGGQFDATSPFDAGYQLLPRYDMDIKYLPVAALGADTSVCANGSVIIGAGNNGDTYAWSNGATTQTITVTMPGTYTVTVSNNGIMETSIDTIVIATLPLPTAGFTSNNGANPTITFTDNSSNATSLSWDFGDGNTATGSSVSNTYAAPGIYTVTLIATNACGSDTISDTLTAIVGIQNAFAGQVSVYPNPNQGQFTVNVEGISSNLVNLTVADQLGRVVFAQVGGTRQNLSLNVAPGLYIVRIATEEGTAFSRVIVK